MERLLKLLFIIFFNIELIYGGCVLNMKEDLTINHPLILSPSSPKWVSSSDSSKGVLNIGRDETVRFACVSAKMSPKNSFKNPALNVDNVVTAICKNGKNFEINKKVYNFDDLMCNSPVEATEKFTNQDCLGKDTELIQVGFQVGHDFVTEYEVCFDKKERHTLYSEVVLSGDIDKSVVHKKEHTWLPKNYESFRNINMNNLYTCNSQIDTFKKILNKNYFEGNKCCLEKAKLVNEDNMMFLPEQASTSHYLNVVPQWSTCNRANWMEVEKRVRNLAIKFNRPLTVWTGTYRKMTLAAKWGFSYKDMYLHYLSDSEKAVPVPLYIWKVIFDPKTEKGVAVIEINNPHLLITDVDSLILCEDICKNVNWLNFLERKTIKDGYVFCCDLHNFEFGFAFKKSPFPKPRGGILRDEVSRG